jgi:hypothetical protein
MAKMGRPTDALKHKFQRILEEANAYERFKQLMLKGKDETFIKAFELSHDRAYGKAPQFVDMEVNDVTQRPTAEDLNAAYESVRNHQNGVSVEGKE